MRDFPIPPNLNSEELINVLSQKSFPDQEVQKYVNAANATYLYWDKLRYKPLANGIEPKIGWHLVKISRRAQRKTTPLLDKTGQPFSYWVPNAALEILHEVDRWAAGTLGVDEKGLSTITSMRSQMIVSSLMEEAIATSQLEGAATTRRVAKEMLRTKRAPRDTSEQMILNSYRTIMMLRDRTDKLLSIDLLHEIHESITQGTLEKPDASGRFRRADEEIHIVDTRYNEILFTPPDAETLAKRIEELIAFTNEPSDTFVHPLVKATILHFWLAYEHPYVDGNGRTARALFYWWMLKNGYWLFEFLTISRIILAAPMQYYRSFLYSETDENDLTYSIMYQLNATHRAIIALREYLERKQEEQRDLAVALEGYPELNERQRAVIERALSEPNTIFTFQSHQALHGVTYVTARSDLLGLLEKDLLQETRRGKQRAFRAVNQLSRILRKSKPGKKRRDSK